MRLPEGWEGAGFRAWAWGLEARLNEWVGGWVWTYCYGVVVFDVEVVVVVEVESVIIAVIFVGHAHW